MTGEPSVILEHVSRTFTRRRRPPLVAVTDFSLTIAEGEFVALVGASGCGKTTVLRMIADLQQPSEGSITRSAAVGARGGTSMVFQRPALLPWRTVLDNVLVPMEVLGRGGRQAEDAAHALLRGVGLREFDGFHPAQLSGGMQQRVALCRALISNPVLLLMDVPFAALDAITRERLMLELQRIWMQHRITVVFVTHNIEEAAFLADRVAVMTPRPGRLAELIEVDIPRPRTLDTLGTPEFVTLTRHIRTMTVELADAEPTALVAG
jgi:NitT/TauT family transport system ATP-binding protein